jgi:predicted AAA+ superfamily ATPase
MKILRDLTKMLVQSLAEVPVVAILGPRQCGKTTLVTMLDAVLPGVLRLDMESEEDSRALGDASAFFKLHGDTIICIDEVQRRADLFPALRHEVDRLDKNGRFIILGSASPDLIRQTSESLAGRIRYLELTPFTIQEAAGFADCYRTLWLRGGFPRSFLADSDGVSYRWRQDFIRTFLEQDIPALGFRIAPSHINRFWTMLAHVNGSVFNRSKFGESLGISHPTVTHYLDILNDTFMIRILPPYEANLKKRLVKSPKVLFRDTGLLHTLLGIRTHQDLMSHPEYGASWEAFAIEQILSAPDIISYWKPYFYRSHQGEEIDLILDNGVKRIAVECKVSSSPEVSKGLRIAIRDLAIPTAWIVAPVERSYPAGEGIMVGRIEDLLKSVVNGSGSSNAPLL